MDICKAVPDVNNFFSWLEKLYVFTSGSLMHEKLFAVQAELYPADAPRQLQRFSDTRWACRIVACRHILDRLDALVQFFRDCY